LRYEPVEVMGMDLRATPVRTFISRLVLSLLSLFIPEVRAACRLHNTLLIELIDTGLSFL
jgi:hypothetical protein